MIHKLTSSTFCLTLALVAMLAMTTRSSATDKHAEVRPPAAEIPESSSPNESYGGQCRAPIGGGATRSELRGLATVERSLPGTWRRDLKFSDPVVRLPMSGAGTVISPEGPAPGRKPGNGRWLDGYRPSTPKAQAEYKRWLEENQAKDADGLKVARSNQLLPPQFNMMNPELAQKQGEQPSGYIVRHDVAVASVVDVKHLAPGTAAPKNTPKSDIHHRSGLTYEQYREIKERATNREETLGAQDADQTPVTRAPSPLISSFDAIPAQGGVPPDPIMAAGLSHIVAIVNSHYQAYDKTGTPVTGIISLDSFFSSVPQCSGTFDPFIDYDEENDRWVMGMDDFAGSDSYFCIAASQTGDPTGSWNVYSFRSDAMATTTGSDFPHMGIGLDAVYISANMFADVGGFDHVRLWAVDKAALYSGSPISVAEADLGAAYFTVQPVKIHGFLSGGWPAPGTPHHFISHNFSTTTQIWRWVNPFSQAPTIYGSVVATNLGAPPNAPELGGGTLNDTSIGDFLDAEYRGGNLYTARAVGCNIGGGSSESCIDWLKIDVSGGSPVLLEQQSGGAFGSADEYRYYPDISVDRANNIAIGYTKSGPSIFTELHVTGREVGDPVGQLQAETLQVMGLGNYTDGAGCGGSCDRWGDYSGMTIDPDGCTFWYLGEYSNGGVGNWQTNIGSYKFPSCSVESLVNVNKSTFNCGEQVTVTVSDSVALTEAEVSAQVVVTTSSGDSETIPVGQWTGSGCTANACTEWTTQLPTSGDPASINDGKIDVADGGTISVDYIDFHAGHSNQNRTVGVDCQTRFDDGGFLVAGGCEDGTGAELYRDYFDGGELIAYTTGFFNPASAPALTDVVASLSISGPASGLITIYNPTVHVGPISQGRLGGAVFYLSVDPGVDTAALRLSAHDFNISITSPADGYIVPQVIVQEQFVQADDVIVNDSECYNFESGTQGFQNERYVFSYFCDSCVPATTVNTVAAPWTFGPGCDSETRTDQTDSTCDVGGSSAFKTNSGAFSCGNFAESSSTLMDDLLYSPIFGPTMTGTAPSGQPWNWIWRFAEWFYRSESVDGSGNFTVAWAHYWNDNYEGISDPAENEVDSYPWFLGFFVYNNQDWDSSTPWDPDNTPANYDAISFPSTASGEATPGLQWRWVFENFDADFGINPQTTAPTLGTAIDNMQLFYDQFYADVQVGTCSGAVGTVAFDQFGYAECPGADLGLAVLDGDAGGSVTVTVTSAGTGDSETVTIVAAGPNYESSLPYSTSNGGVDDDGTLYVTPQDTIRISYDDTSPVDTATSAAFIDCPGGSVVLEGIVGLQDDGTGDGDGNADQNEIIDLSLRIRNDTANDLTNVRAVISSSDPTVSCMLKASADFGTIAANGGTASNSLAADPFTFVVADTAQCTDPSTPPTATFNVFITADGLSGSAAPQTFTLRMDVNDLGSTVILDENFDGVQPAGWTHQVGPGDEDGVTGNGAGGLPCLPYGDNWFWRNSDGNTGGGFFCWNNPADNFPNGTYDDLLDAELISPVLVIPAGGNSATLTFDHEYKFAGTATLRVDGAVVYYRVNGGPWQKIETLPYDGALIFNTYCNPLCNGGDDLGAAGTTPPNGTDCFHETAGDGEDIFCLFSNGRQDWTTVQATVLGLNAGDQVEFRWRVGSMNSAGGFGLDTTGGYGLDNVQVSAGAQECDTAVTPKVGCGVTFDSAGNLVELCGDGDSSVEPGEQWSVDVRLVNEGDTSAVSTVGDLTVNVGGVQATVSGNPGNYGTIAAGATSTANYSFIVDGAAVCIDDLDFDITSIADNATLYDDVPNAFAVQVGTLTAAETGFQGTDPLESTGPIVGSILSPIFSLAGADTGTLSYDFESLAVAGNELATQDTDPLNINNTSASSTLSPAFTITGGGATAATLNWTTLTSNNVNRCAQVALFAPGGASTILKAFNTDDLSPYDVLSFYQGNGPGQYTVELTDSSNGPCGGGGGFSNLSGTTMSVDGLVVGGDWDANVRVYLWDGSTQTIVKDFGAADAGPYDISSLYTGSAQYEVRLEAQNGEGFRMTNGVMSITQASCDVAACVPGSSAPPVGDDVVGTGIRLDKGAGANDIDITFDTATCSDDHAIVVYGNLGDFTGYQGAVDAGCNVGTGGSTTFTHAGSGVWFNVLWVTSDDKAGHPGYDGGGLIRPWNAVGLCGATSDDPSDGVCN